MRARDLTPLLPLAAIAAFIVWQARAANAPPAAPDPAQNAPAGTATIPQGSAAPSSSALPATPPSAARNDALLRLQIAERSDGTYLTEILRLQDDFLARWRERQVVPVRVFIAHAPALANWTPRYRDVASVAFDEWRAAGFPMEFYVVRDSSTADIRIGWITRFTGGESARIGVTRVTRDQDGWIMRADIMIATHDTAGRALPAAMIGGIARHEIGHALGLNHSPSPADVMYPQSTTPAISPRDRATLHALYTLPPGRVR